MGSRLIAVGVVETVSTTARTICAGQSASASSALHDQLAVEQLDLQPAGNVHVVPGTDERVGAVQLILQP